MGNATGEGHLFPPFGDWKTGKRYPDPKKTDHKQWAWEFLRRNPKYQQEWKMVQDLLGKFKLPNNHIHPTVWKTNPERLDDETIEEYFSRISMDKDYCRDDGGIDWNKVHPHQDIVAYSWGLEEMLDPTISEYKIYGFLRGATIRTQWHFIGGTKTISMEPYETFIVFDLRKDIKTNLGMAERNLKKLQDTHREKIKKHIDPDLVNKRKPPSDSSILKEWLRILDANQSGVTNSEIKSAKITDTINLKEKLTRAKEYRDTGYRLLAENISPRI